MISEGMLELIGVEEVGTELCSERGGWMILNILGWQALSVMMTVIGVIEVEFMALGGVFRHGAADSHR